MSVSTEHAWQALSRQLRAFFRRRVTDDQLAEDLLQETFVRVLAPDGVVADAIPEENTAEENYNEEIAAGLGCIVQQLSPRYREAIELTELQGLTQSEVGARLGLSLSGAKSRVQRGRAKLKDLLLECCHFELDRHGNVIDYRPQHACSGCGENPTTAQASPITTSQSDSCCG